MMWTLEKLSKEKDMDLALLLDDINNKID